MRMVVTHSQEDLHISSESLHTHISQPGPDNTHSTQISHICQKDSIVSVSSGAMSHDKNVSTSGSKEGQNKSLMKILSEAQRKLTKHPGTGRRSISSRSKAKSKLLTSKVLAG